MPSWPTQGHPAGPHDRGAGGGGRHSARPMISRPTRSSRRASTCGWATVAYRVRASFLPGPRTTVAERIDELKLHEIALADGAVLETGCVYIVPLLESLALPTDIAAAANPKSSTGRLDVFTRVIADATRGFDRIEAGYHGPLYAEISPKTFPGAGARRLAAVANPLPPRPRRARCRRRCARCMRASGWSMPSDADVERRHRGQRRSRRPAGRDGLVGYRAKRHTGADRRRAPRRLSTSPISGSRCMARRRPQPDPRSRRVLHPGLEGGGAGAARLCRRDGAVRSAGRRIPRALCRLLRSRASATRAPAGSGARAVLEVRSREVPFILEHGQIVGRLVYEKMLARPDTLYGEGIGSNYQAQGLKLSKHFRV